MLHFGPRISGVPFKPSVCITIMQSKPVFAAMAVALNGMFENPKILIKNGVKFLEADALAHRLTELRHGVNGYVARTT